MMQQHQHNYHQFQNQEYFLLIQIESDAGIWARKKIYLVMDLIFSCINKTSESPTMKQYKITFKTKSIFPS